VLYVLYGPDTFTVHEGLHRVIVPYLAVEGENPETVRLDGPTATPAQIATACQQFTLLSGTRIVVVEGLLSRFEPEKPARDRARKGKAKKAGLPPEWESFVPRVAGLPDKSVLVLLDAELKAGNYLLKALKAQPNADVREMLPPRGDSLVAWIRERAAGTDARIDDDAARQLGVLAGADLWQLNSEIQKLAVYADGKPITAEMIRSMTASSVSSTIFMLVDAIVEGKQTEARRRLDQMYRDGLSAGYVFTMVGRQIRIIAQLLEARQHRGSAQPVGELAGMHEFAVRRASDQARKFDERRVLRALEAVVAADRSIKTGLCDDRTALEQMVTDLLPAPSRS